MANNNKSDMLYIAHYSGDSGNIRYVKKQTVTNNHHDRAQLTVAHSSFNNNHSSIESPHSNPQDSNILTFQRPANQTSQMFFITPPKILTQRIHSLVIIILNQTMTSPMVAWHFYFPCHIGCRDAYIP